MLSWSLHVHKHSKASKCSPWWGRGKGSGGRKGRVRPHCIPTFKHYPPKVRKCVKQKFGLVWKHLFQWRLIYGAPSSLWKNSIQYSNWTHDEPKKNRYYAADLKPTELSRASPFITSREQVCCMPWRATLCGLYVIRTEKWPMLGMLYSYLVSQSKMSPLRQTSQ